MTIPDQTYIHLGSEPAETYGEWKQRRGITDEDELRFRERQEGWRHGGSCPACKHPFVVPTCGRCEICGGPVPMRPDPSYLER